MPYRKRTYRRRPRRRYVRQSKTKKMVTGHGPTMLEKIASGVGSVAKLAGAVAPVIAAINTELKYVDTNLSATVYNPGTNDQLTCITNNISQGTDDTNRIGNSVLFKDMYIKGYLQFAASASVVTNAARMIIFVWKDNANANAPSAAKLLESPATFASAINKDYSDSLVIIKDKMWSFDSPVAASVSAGTQIFKFYKKLDFHGRWLNTTTGNTQNHVYILFRGASGVVGNATTFSMYSRVNYTDN